MTDYNYYLVTSIFDVKKYYPGINRWRSSSKYIELFNYFYELNLPTIVFIEDHLKDKIKKMDNFHTIVKNMDELPAYQLLKDKDNLRPISNGQHLNKEFTAVINSKFYLLQEAKEYLIRNNLLSSITHLIWLDAGIAHIETIDPLQFKEDIKLHMHDKIMNVLMKAVTSQEVTNLDSYLQCSYGKIAAGLFVVPINMVNWYYEELWKYFKYSVEELKLLCYEEQLMSVLVGKHPEKFDFSFSDYFLLKNLRYITNDLHTVLNNLTFCREHNLLDIAMKIITLTFTSIGKSRLQISEERCCQFLYDAQICSFYRDKSISKMSGLLLGYMYYNNASGKKWVFDRFGNIKTNLGYIGIDLDNETLFKEEYIISEIDIYKILWKIF